MVRRETNEATPADRERLRARFGKRFSSGAVLFSEGEPAASAFLLEQGRVRLIKRVRAVERSLMVVRPGELFGESAFVPGSIRSSTAIALSDGAALELDRASLAEVIETDRVVGPEIVEQLVRRLRDAEDRVETMMLRDNQSKIVSGLLKLCEQSAPEAAGAVSLRISPLDLSTRAGLDVETIKRGVQKLRDGQYVRVVDEKIEVPDVDALKRLFTLLGVKDEIRGADFPRPRGA